MKETSARLLRLLSLLQLHREWTGTDLSTRLAVSPRTVRKDIERLRDLGYPVEATRGARGGYRLGAGATMPPLLLDDEEAVAVAIGLGTAATRGVGGVEEASLRALAKLEQVLPTRLRRRVEALRASTAAVPPDTAGPDADAEVLQLLANACRDHERQRITYRRHDGESRRRLVEPHRLVSWGRRWYLVAWDDDRADWRTFRVDRIAKTDPTGSGFAPRALPAEDLPAWLAGNTARAAWRYRARFAIEAPAEAVLARINPAVGSVEAVDDDTCILHTGADSLETIAVWIGMLGFEVRLLDPPELGAFLRELADRYRRAAPDAPEPTSN